MVLHVLVCTLDEGITRVPHLLKPEREDVRYVVSFQYSDEKFLSLIPDALRREDVRIVTLPGRGLCRNRNHVMTFVNDGIALIADDDLFYFEDTFDTILDTFRTHEEIDLAFFKTKTPDGEPEYREYPSIERAYTRWKGYAPCSREIAFRVEAVKQKGIWFDERFGLGSARLSGGEELMFVDACLKQGLQARFFPKYIVLHPCMSNGDSSAFTLRAAMTMGALCHHFLGWLAFRALFNFSWQAFINVKKRPVSPFKYYIWLVKGILYERATR